MILDKHGLERADFYRYLQVTIVQIQGPFLFHNQVNESALDSVPSIALSALYNGLSMSNANKE